MEKTFRSFTGLNFCYVTMWILVLVLLGHGCSDSIFPVPILDNIIPAVGYNGLPTDVSIKGKHFYRSMTHNLSNQNEFSVDSHFIAELLRDGQQGIDLVLTNVAYVDDQTLTATIAPGMDVGLYGLVVTDPRGLTGSLSGAFVVTDQPPPAIMEITPFQIVNDSDTTFTVLGSNFTQGLELFAGETQLEIQEVSATQIESTIPASFPEGIYSVSVHNPDGQFVIRAEGIQVFGSALLISTLMVSPNTARLGESLSIDLTITNQGQTAVEMLSVAVPVVWGSGSALIVSGPTPDSVILLAPLETQVFSWNYQAGQLGQITFETQATGINQYSGRTIETGPVQSEPVSIIECADASECHNPTPICTVSGLCSACTTDEQCEMLSPDYQRCDTSTGSCLPCLEHADCGTPWPYCDLDTNTCVECLEASECNDMNICTDDTCDNHACVHDYNTAPCDDGLFCTAIDTCSLGVCSGSGDPCLGGMECADSCDEINNNCNQPLGISCADDGIECTDDQCDGSGACTHPNKSAGAACGLLTDDDCTNPDTCDGSGLCLDNHEGSGTACTDDGIECTNDQCDGSGTCTHPDKAAGAACGLLTDDDCTNPDACDGSGLCLDNHEGSGTACTDDGIECTNDQCDGSGACTHPNKSAGAACGLLTDDDCTNPDACDGSGLCLDNHEGSGTACTDDGIECTDDQCDGSGACTHPNKSAGAACGLLTDDDCTNPDSCDGSGLCLDNHEGSGTACTDDGIECTDDQCDGSGACTHPNKSAGAACGLLTDDDCTNPDSCDGSGLCLDNHEGSGIACTDDGIECTDDQCDGSGTCTHPDKAAGAACGLLTDDDCTNPDSCDGSGLCLDNHEGSGTACTDDGIECTDDQCDGSGTCTHPDKAAGAACGLLTDDDCTNPDACDGSGLCLDNHEGSGTACTDDGIECTDDQCDGSGTCTHPDKSAGAACGLLTDDDCTNPDSCDGSGLCLDNHEGSGTACTDDGIDCTDDQCDGSGSCTHPDKALGVSCTDDGAFCTGTESCDGAGACVSSGDPCSGQLCDESADACEDYIVIDDPLLDGSNFSFVFAYRGKIWVGPRENGTGAVSMNPDGSSPTSVSFSFYEDTNGNKHDNNAGGPYPSIGYTGCAKDTYECGPDNEDGRGIFCSGTIGGDEWLVIGGSRSGGNLDYVYMTLDNDAVLDFSFLDLDQALKGGTRGFSAAHVFGDRLYLGFPGTDGDRPYLTMVFQTPSQPGLDAISNGGGPCEPGPPPTFDDVCNLEGKDIPDLGNSEDPSIIDSIVDFNDRLYLANYGGIARSTTDQPLDVDDFPEDWIGITPLSNNDYTDLISYATGKIADLEPADKAIPNMVSFGGRLFLARNTTVGPQLWSCTPSIESGPPPATAVDCDPGDWQLIAPNTTGNTQLTQFNNPSNTHITLLEASASYLYVGFDNANPAEGVVLFRTSNTSAVATSDFEGDAGCSASQHPASCDGIGGNGFGDPSIIRIFSYVIASLTGTDWLYIIVGNGTDPVKLFVFSG